jgi:hypothetical protein
VLLTAHDWLGYAFGVPPGFVNVNVIVPVAPLVGAGLSVAVEVTV